MSTWDELATDEAERRDRKDDDWCALHADELFRQGAEWQRAQLRTDALGLEGDMSTWAERAYRTAEALDMEAIEATDPEDVRYGFREGAAWQREQLIADTLRLEGNEDE